MTVIKSANIQIPVSEINFSSHLLRDFLKSFFLNYYIFLFLGGNGGR